MTALRDLFAREAWRKPGRRPDESLVQHLRWLARFGGIAAPVAADAAELAERLEALERRVAALEADRDQRGPRR